MAHDVPFAVRVGVVEQEASGKPPVGGVVIITRPRRSDDDDGVLGGELRVEF